jgi:gamma-glutamyltranspeptidase/glutathione hydrolase
LIPGLALRDGSPALVFGSMGGHGQAQFHLQLLTRILAGGEDILDAIDAPRWIASPGDGRVRAEERFGEAWFERLRARGHEVQPAPDFNDGFGHAHAIAVTEEGYRGATDPRAEGAVLGLDTP